MTICTETTNPYLYAKACSLVREHAEEISAKGGPFRYFNGKHSEVFSHPDFPGLVFKWMSPSQATESIEALRYAKERFSQRGFSYCHVPNGVIFPITAKNTLFIMEKAKGTTDVEQAQEAMEQEFERIPENPDLYRKWEAMTQELAEAVAEIGYWDSQRKNLIWDTDKGWSFIDFERIEANPSLICTGLSRLVGIVPPLFVEKVYQVARHNSVVLPLSEEEAISKRQEEFTTRREWSRWHYAKPLPREIDKERWPESSWARRIVEKFDENRTLCNTYCSPGSENYLFQHTTLHWQPFFGFEETYSEERARFECGLEELLKAGVIQRWKAEENPYGQDALVAYTIYF